MNFIESFLLIILGLVIFILSCIGFIIYQDATSTTFSLEKDKWICEKSEYRTGFFLMVQ
jgi:hypothetical protein